MILNDSKRLTLVQNILGKLILYYFFIYLFGLLPNTIFLKKIESVVGQLQQVHTHTHTHTLVTFKVMKVNDVEDHLIRWRIERGKGENKGQRNE